MISRHSHLIECDEGSRELVIYRVHEDGRRVLYTRISFAQIRMKGYTSFVSELGEAIAFDAPLLSQIFDDLHTKVLELCRAKRYADAHALCQAELEKELSESERANVYSIVSYALECEGRFEESLDILNQARDLDRSHRGVLDNMMRTQIRLGRFEQAMASADELISIDAQFPYQPFTSSAYFHKAYATWKFGRLDEAMQTLEKSSEVEPIWIDGGLLSKDQLAAMIKQVR